MIEVKHRTTGAVLATFETLTGANLSGTNLRGAYLRGTDLSGAYLRGTDLSATDLRLANLRGADLREANLRGAVLREANLRGAVLREANLRGAVLSLACLNGASLSGTNLRGATINGEILDRLLARATRLDGYEFFLFALEDGASKIKAGCRWLTITDYRAHVAKEYPDTDKARETLSILDYFDACNAALTEPT